ncbi:MAG: ATP-binding protein [Sneathiellaceae bacterium]
MSTGLLFGIVYWIASDFLLAQARIAVDSEMTTMRTASRSGTGDPLLSAIAERQSLAGAAQFYYGLQNPDGHLVGGNLPVVPQQAGWQEFEVPVGTGRLKPFEGRDEETGTLLARVHLLADGRRLTVAIDTFLITEAQEAIVRAFGWAAVAGLILALLGGVALSRNFLRRVDALNRTVRAIMSGRISERIEVGSTGDELDQLGQSLNEMLDRLQASLEGLKQVSDDIAHDLRTPLSRLKQGLEATLRVDADKDVYRQSIDEAICQADAALSTFGALLRIAQIESGSRRQRFVAVDLSDLLTGLAATYTPVSEDSGRALTAAVEPGILCQGDRELLVQLFVNLIENGLRHTPDGAAVAIGLARSDGDIVATISDTGSGIPIAERKHVFRRFYRLDASRNTPGNGLGLSLVAAVAELHGAEVQFDDNHPGLIARVRFPGQRRS